MKRQLFVLVIVLIFLLACTPQPTPIPTPEPTIPFIAPTPPYQVKVTKDIEYVRLLAADEQPLMLDVYAPAETGSWPVVVLLISGFQTKDSAAYTTLSKDLAGRRVVVFTPQRRSISATVLDAAKENGWEYREVHECWACSVRYAREKAADYGGDGSRITVFGHDGGGFTAAFMGDDQEQARDEAAALMGGPPVQTECLAGDVSAGVEAFVVYSGDCRVYEVLKDSHPEQYALTSPYALIGRNKDLRIYLVMGKEEAPDMYQRMVDYQDALVEAGYDVTWIEMAKGEYAIPWDGIEREKLIQAVLEAAGG